MRMRSKSKRRQSEDSGFDMDSVEDLIPTPPDGGWGWVIVMSSLMCNVIVDGIVFSFGIFLIEFVKTFNASKFKVSLAGSLLCGTYLLVGPIVSALTNKYGCRKVACAGSIFASASFIISTFSPNIDILILTYGVMGGFGFGLIYLPSIVSVGYYFEKKRALATGVAVCGSGLGTFIFSPLSKYLLDVYDWKNALYILAGVILNGVVCGMLMRPLLPGTSKKRKRIAKNDQSQPKAVKGRNKETNNKKPNVIPRIILKDTESVIWDITDGEVPGSPRENDKQDETTPVDGSGVREGEKSDNEIPPSSNVTNTVSRNRGVANGNAVNSNEKLSTRDRSASFKEKRTGSSLLELTLSKRALQRDLSVTSADFARLLYRKDIFYSGSVLNIPQFQSQQDMQRYIASVTEIPGAAVKESWFWRHMTCIPKSAKDTLQEMLDFSLLKNPGFLFICLGNILAMIGFLTPFVYTVDRAVQLGIAETEAAFLLSAIGITNTVGRIFSGWIADRPWCNSLLLNNIALLISGLATMLVPLTTSYATMMTYACVFGLCISAFVSLTSIILCDLLGLEKLTNAFGLLTLFRGISAIIGPPIAGAIFDKMGTFDVPFYLSGGMIAAGAGLHFVLFLPCIKRRMNTTTDAAQRKEPKAPENEGLLVEESVTVV